MSSSKFPLLFSGSVVSNSLQTHGLRHTRPPCPSLSPRICSNSCQLSGWCHPTISSSIIPFASCPQSFPASGSFLMSQLFTAAAAAKSLQLCPTLCDPIDGSPPGSPVLSYLPEFAQTHVHGVDDAIQPSHPLSFTYPFALNLSHHQGLFQWVSSSHQAAKVLEFQL